MLARTYIVLSWNECANDQRPTTRTHRCAHTCNRCRPGDGSTTSTKEYNQNQITELIASRHLPISLPSNTNSTAALPLPGALSDCSFVPFLPRILVRTLVVQSAHRLLAGCLLSLRMASSGLSAVFRRVDAVARRRPPPPPLPGLANIFVGRFVPRLFSPFHLLLFFVLDFFFLFSNRK